MNVFVSAFGGVSSVTTICVFLLTFVLVFFSIRRRRGIPPGPPLIPVVGNLFSLVSRDFMRVLRNLRNKYGDIYGLYIGSELVVFLNGYDVIHEALLKKGSVFGKRPTSASYELVVTHPAIVNGNGSLWKEQRTFFQNSLKELCFMQNGRNIETLINAETECLVVKLKDIDGAFKIDDYVTVSVANVICKLMLNHRFDFDDEQFIKILSTFNKAAYEFGKTQVTVNCFPYLQNFPGDFLNLRFLQDMYWVVVNALKPFLEQHKQRHDDKIKTDLVDLFIERQKQNAEANLKDSFTDAQLEANCYDLLGAGSETTATTIRWLLLYLIREPSIQEKMYAEISRELGKTPPTLRDRSSLVYVEAVILEGLRIACITPLAVPHAISQDLMFRNYLIPDKSTIIVNLESVLRDPNIWENPTKFRPERFLNEDKTELFIPEEFIPFSLGPRSCAGESLARMELFLFMTSLVQAYEFHSAEDDGALPDTTGHIGLTYTPRSFLIRISKR